MPPASRGLQIAFRFVRYASKTSNPKIPKPLARLKEKVAPQLTPRRADTSYQEGHNSSGNQRSGQQNSKTRWSFFSWITPTHRLWIWRLFFIGPPVGFVILHFPLEVMRVTGPSMSPLLNADYESGLFSAYDRILVQKVMFPDRPGARPTLPRWQVKRGQLVVFYAPHDPEKVAVKRVVGVPGDRIKPREGYPGGDEPVVVPYNHIWVEGDGNTTLDSNAYGPISQNLVIGFVRLMWKPWLNWPVSIDWEHHDYPAKKYRRVEEDVVHQAKLDPNQISNSEAFTNGVAARELEAMRKFRDQLPTRMMNEQNFHKLRYMYAQAKEEFELQNPKSTEVAQGIMEELGNAFESVGLARDGNRLPPAIMPAETEQEVKQRKLKEYLERNTPKEVKNDCVPAMGYLTA
ncbi:peptidase S24/S26A/S26B/S26C [Exophiala viscosa]|uniref:Mitochondrial inner membrane protease subunit 2 n=1 Tax=Exophiala viscosa TaxID=2486360 RepID=A0AAN6DWY1_9EURO|nr:peptidase S24/S26A/S26B/S26C [Exophiala viscosa]